MKKVLITGINGQDGSHLTELLIKKNKPYRLLSKKVNLNL